MLGVARRKNPDCRFIGMDMRCLAFKEKSLSGVWANGCIYHVPKKDFSTVLLEVNRILEPKGIFAFNFKIGEGEGLDSNPRSYDSGPRYYAYYGTDEMADLLNGTGFEIVAGMAYLKTIFGESIWQVFARKL